VLYDTIMSWFRMTGIAWLGSALPGGGRLGRAAIIGSVLALQPSAVSRVGAQTIAAPAPPDSRGDFARLVDIGGGRRVYLECRGAGGPTVVLEAGYRASGRIWSEDFRPSAGSRTMVLAGVATYTRVCAYDRPGTVAPLKDDVRPSRSDPVPQPRTAQGTVNDLDALLQAAGVAGPFVLVGHSLGGLFVRLFASTYPTEVVGLILVDPYSERLETILTPERWAALVRLNVRQGTDTTKPIPGYGDLETLGFGKDNIVMRSAAVSSPLHPEGFSSDALEAVLRTANEQMATLAPNARFFVAKDSGHDIHQDQPELVTEAIRQVVAGVRHPETWYDLTSCCAK
jgi:pimeloyl-ACP methyl ester carboxylesterase